MWCQFIKPPPSLFYFPGIVLGDSEVPLLVAVEVYPVYDGVDAGVEDRRQVDKVKHQARNLKSGLGFFMDN